MTLGKIDKKPYITEPNMERLEYLLSSAEPSNKDERENLNRLMEDLDRADVVALRDIPADIVTMNSMVKLRDLDSGEEMVFTLVFPSSSDVSKGKISVLAPVGSAILGYKAGDIIEWKVPGRMRRLRIEKVLYQPKAAGELKE
jgi:regulator of nucleoside diphosphate kinase